MGILKAACPLSPPLPGTSFPPYFTSINSRADMLPQDPGQSQLLPRGYLFAESIYLLHVCLCSHVCAPCVCAPVCAGGRGWRVSPATFTITACLSPLPVGGWMTWDAGGWSLLSCSSLPPSLHSYHRLPEADPHIQTQSQTPPQGSRAKVDIVFLLRTLGVTTW